MVPFIGQAYKHRSNAVSSQESVNLYPEIISDANAKSKYILVGTPGTKKFADIPTDGACRGLFTVASKADSLAPISSRSFGIYGAKLYEINLDGTVDDRGDISDLSTRISLCDAGSHLIFVDGSTMYAFELATNTLTNVSIPFDQPTQVIFINERVVCINADETLDELLNVKNYNKFYWSNINDPTSWDTLYCAQTRDARDPNIAISKRSGELIVFGTTTVEAYRGGYSADSAFIKAGGSGTEVGCGAINSVINTNGQVFWLGNSTNGKNQFFTLSGYKASPISTEAIATQLESFDTSDCISYTYQQEGHQFILFTFIEGNCTWCYDLITDEWHKRSTRDPSTNTQNKWNVVYITFGNNKILCGNITGKYVLELDLNTYTDFISDDLDVVIQRVRVSPVYWEDMKVVKHKKFILDCEVGVGNESHISYNSREPNVMLQYSDDSGKTYSNELWVSLGKAGQYITRVCWRRLGSSRNRVYKLVITAPVKIVLIGAKIVKEATKWN